MFAISQTATTIFTIDNSGKVITKSQFINPPYDNSINNYGFSLSNPPVQVQVGTVTYTIKTGNFEMSNENDYDVVEISKDGNRVCLHREEDGILKLKEGSNRNDGKSHRLGKYANNNYCIEVPLSSTSKALLFFGPSYGSSVAKTLIFVLTESNAKLVFNKTLEPQEMKNITSNFEMKLIADIPECDLDGNEIPSPSYTIWKEGGVLKHKKD